LRGTDHAKSIVDEALAEARAKILTPTAEPAQASPSHHRNTAAIVGGVAGGGSFSAFVLIGFVAFFLVRRRHVQREQTREAKIIDEISELQKR
jgi:MYXO-CTERM domain-containing protein